MKRKVPPSQERMPARRIGRTPGTERAHRPPVGAALGFGFALADIDRWRGADKRKPTWKLDPETESCDHLLHYVELL